jgi:SAM-dependent methyltransferase
MSLPADYFDRLYDGNDDPWGFADRWYESRKRSATLAALTRPRYGDAFEPGCSVGLLTSALAQRCDHLLGTDVSSRALELARARVGDATQVRLEQRSVPDEWPLDRRFDLVVVSELGYYLDPDDLDRLARLAETSLAPDGELVLCHWRHPVADYPLRGDDVHERVLQTSGLAVAVSHTETDFRLDVLVPRGRERSVARETGIR